MRYKVGDRVILTGTDVKATIVEITDKGYGLKVDHWTSTTYWNEKDFRPETNEEWFCNLSTEEKAVALWNLILNRSTNKLTD